jgi:hypothetical protein
MNAALDTVYVITFFALYTGPKKQNKGTYLAFVETARQKEGDRTNLWRECFGFKLRSITYEAITNW